MNKDEIFSNIDLDSGFYKDRLKKLNAGRKKHEKETSEHFEPKYKMYIIPHKSFVSDYEGYGHEKMSGKRYCFQMGSYKEAILLTVEEVVNCIADCANRYCNWRFKVMPEDEFLSEYEDYKKSHREELEKSHFRYGFNGDQIDVDNILNQPKQKKQCQWGCLIREYYGDRGIFGDPLDAMPFYSLYSDSVGYTSTIVGYKKTNEGIEFETMNSIYVVEKMKDFGYIDQLKEFDDYKKSPHYKKVFDWIKNYEDEVMKNIMEGKNYIN